MRALAIALTAVLLPACPQQVCDTMAAVSVVVTVEDQDGNLISDPQLELTWESADGGGDCDNFSGQWNCGYEVGGDITILAVLGEAEASTTVTVSEGECHVIGEEVTLVLDLTVLE